MNINLVSSVNYGISFFKESVFPLTARQIQFLKIASLAVIALAAVGAAIYYFKAYLCKPLPQSQPRPQLLPQSQPQSEAQLLHQAPTAVPLPLKLKSQELDFRTFNSG